MVFSNPCILTSLRRLRQKVDVDIIAVHFEAVQSDFSHLPLSHPFLTSCTEVQLKYYYLKLRNKAKTGKEWVIG